MGDAASTLVDAPGLNDAGDERMVANKSRRGSDPAIQKRWIIEERVPLPPLVLTVNTILLRGAIQAGLIENIEEVFCVLLVDGQEKGRMVSYPSQPIKLGSCTTSSVVALRLFSSCNPNDLKLEDASQLSKQSIDWSRAFEWTLMAEICLPLSQLAAYGVPLYTALWLGIEDTNGSTQDFTQAVRMSRNLDVPKVHITVFRPEEKRTNTGEAPVDALTNIPTEPEPDLQSVFDEKEIWARYAAPKSSLSRPGQVRGLVEALKLSTRVAYCWQDALGMQSPQQVSRPILDEADHLAQINYAKHSAAQARAELQVAVQKNRQLEHELSTLRNALDAADSQSTAGDSQEMRRLNGRWREAKWRQLQSAEIADSESPSKSQSIGSSDMINALREELEKTRAELESAEATIAREREEASPALVAQQVEIQTLENTLGEYQRKLIAEQGESGRLQKKLDETLTLLSMTRSDDQQNEIVALKSALEHAESSLAHEKELSTSAEVTSAELAKMQHEVERLQATYNDAESRACAEQEISARLQQQVDGLLVAIAEQANLSKQLQSAEDNALQAMADLEDSSKVKLELQQEMARLEAALEDQRARNRDDLQEKVKAETSFAELQAEAERAKFSSLREQMKLMLADASASMRSQMQNSFSTSSDNFAQAQIELQREVDRLHLSVETQPEEIYKVRDMHKKVLATFTDEVVQSRTSQQAEIDRLQAALDALQATACSFREQMGSALSSGVVVGTPVKEVQRGGVQPQAGDPPDVLLMRTKSELTEEMTRMRAEVGKLEVTSKAEVQRSWELVAAKGELESELKEMTTKYEDAIGQVRRSSGFQAAEREHLERKLEELEKTHAEVQQRAIGHATEKQDLLIELDELRKSHQDAVSQLTSAMTSSIEEASTGKAEMSIEMQKLQEELSRAEARVKAEREQSTILREQFETALASTAQMSVTSTTNLQAEMLELKASLEASEKRVHGEQQEAIGLRDYAEKLRQNEKQEQEYFVQGTKAFNELQAEVMSVKTELNANVAKVSQVPEGSTSSAQVEGFYILQMFWRLLCEKYSHLSADELAYAFRLETRPSTLMRSEVERVLNMYKAHQKFFSVSKAFQKLDVMRSGILARSEFEQRVEKGLQVDNKMASYIYKIMLDQAKSGDGRIREDDFNRVFGQFSGVEAPPPSIASRSKTPPPPGQTWSYSGSTRPRPSLASTDTAGSGRTDPHSQTGACTPEVSVPGARQSALSALRSPARMVTPGANSRPVTPSTPTPRSATVGVGSTIRQTSVGHNSVSSVRSSPTTSDTRPLLRGMQGRTQSPGPVEIRSSTSSGQSPPVSGRRIPQISRLSSNVT